MDSMGHVVNKVSRLFYCREVFQTTRALSLQGQEEGDSFELQSGATILPSNCNGDVSHQASQVTYRLLTSLPHNICCQAGQGWHQIHSARLHRVSVRRRAPASKAFSKSQISSGHTPQDATPFNRPSICYITSRPGRI